MPLYEFQCDACRSDWEDFYPMGVCPSQCPTCGSYRVRRVFTPPVKKIDETTSERYLQWYYSDEVQNGLKTGKYRHIRKDEDVNHI